MKPLALACLFMAVDLLQADPTVSNQAPVPPIAQNAQASKPAVPQSGQSLGTITTTDGKSYADAKLAVIEPDGISIIYSDGGAKIPFTALSPDLQKQFGYDPEKSAFYAREQQYLAQIDKLQQENAELRKRLNIVDGQEQTQPANPKAPQSTVAGFHCFLDHEVKLSEPQRMFGQGQHVKVGYSQGPYRGMAPGEAAVAAQQQWASMSDGDKTVWEKNAQFYGDPIVKKEAAEANQPPQQSINATVIDQSGNVANVHGYAQ